MSDTCASVAVPWDDFALLNWSSAFAMSTPAPDRTLVLVDADLLLRAADNAPTAVQLVWAAIYAKEET